MKLVIIYVTSIIMILILCPEKMPIYSERKLRTLSKEDDQAAIPSISLFNIIVIPN